MTVMRAVGGALLALIAVTGCGGGSRQTVPVAAPPSPAAAAVPAITLLDVPDAICSALSTAELAEALGISDPVIQEPVGVSGCRFTVREASISIRLDERYEPGTNLAAARRAQDDLYDRPTQVVSGAGHPAFVVVGHAGGEDVASSAGAVRRGDYVDTFQVVQLAGLDPEALRPGSVRLVRLLGQQS